MCIYRIYNFFMTMYSYFNGVESWHANAKLYASAVLTGVGVWVVLELLLGFGLYAMAKKRGFEKRYLAFIPFVNMLYAGRLAGETRLFGQRMKHAGVFLMVTQLIAVIVGAFTMFAEVTLYSNYLLKTVLSADGRTASLVYVTESGGSPTNKFALFLIGYDNVATLILSIVELVYSIFLFLVASALFRRYAPSSYTVLSVVSLFVPMAFPVIVFVLRNKKPIDYAEYLKKRREAYYRRYGAPNGGYGGYGGFGGYGGYNNSPYGGGNYGSTGGDDPFRENGENGSAGDGSDEPFSELGGSGRGSGNNGGNNGGSPFSDIDG